MSALVLAFKRAAQPVIAASQPATPDDVLSRLATKMQRVAVFDPGFVVGIEGVVDHLLAKHCPKKGGA
jgi:hypothetical protein